MIKELIEEMHTKCPYCDGTGMKLDSEGQYIEGSEDLCDQCNEENKVLSHEGNKLRYLILKGELP